MFENVEHTREELHGYQRDIAIPFLKDNPFSGLFIDMGLGKTVSTLTVIADLLMEFIYDQVLVIGPKRVATETWPTEIGLWKHTAHLSFTVINVADDDPRLKAAAAIERAKARSEGCSPQEVARRGGKAETAEKYRLLDEMMRTRSDVHIVSRDWVEYMVEFWGRKWPYRMVVIDESSGFKDHTAKRFMALAKIRCTPGLIERLHILTATPAAESYIHLFAQIFLLDMGERLGKVITHYRAKFFTPNKYSRKWELRGATKADREETENLILAKIADICLVMKAKDYLKMDEPTVLVRPIHLGKVERELYETLQREFIVTLPNGVQIEAETAAALSQKLLQLSSGVLYETVMKDVGDGNFKPQRTVHRIHEKKIEELEQIVDELQGKPLLVGYHFASSLERLQKAFPDAVVMDKEGKCVKQWNAGKIKILLMHPQSGGHGLNLQKGGHHIAFFDIPWSLELYLQFVGRLARQGQQNPVIVWLLAAVDTIDETVCKSLRKKEDSQDRLFRKLRALIKKYQAQKIAAAPMAYVDDDDEL